MGGSGRGVGDEFQEDERIDEEVFRTVSDSVEAAAILQARQAVQVFVGHNWLCRVDTHSVRGFAYGQSAYLRHRGVNELPHVLNFWPSCTFLLVYTNGLSLQLQLTATMSAKQHNLTVLISGNGSNLQALIDACASGKLPNTRITHVISKYCAFNPHSPHT